MRLVLVAVLIAFNILTAGCHSSDPPRQPNILFIVVDTLRRDHVGVYGRDDVTTPFLDSVAGRSVVFRNAYAQSSWTSPSVATMLTSRYPSQHGIAAWGSVLSQEERTIGEILRDGGYATGGFVANILLSDKAGYSQGFDKFEMLSTAWTSGHPKGHGDDLRTSALQWLDSRTDRQKPYFIYIHYMEPHTPFEPPADLVSRSFAGREPPDVAAINDALFNRPRNLTESEQVQAKELYRIEVTGLDHQIELLYRGLAERDLMKNTVVVFTSDHGEAVYERGWWGHGQSLFNEEIAVPLLIAAPDQNWRDDVSENVALVDIAPTLLDFAGIAPPALFEGRSLKQVARTRFNPGLKDRIAGAVSFLHEDEPAPQVVPVAIELPYVPPPGVPPVVHRRAIILGDDKLIQSTDGQVDYYDLVRDPEELHAVPPSLKDALEAFVDKVGSGAGAAAAPEVDEKTRERMRALGYAQ
jgi:arylsulfatase A-like enzyme